MEYKLRGRVWLYPGKASWYFVNVSKKASQDIKYEFADQSRGFGSIPVEVTVGETSWETSIFPDNSGTYLLPLKVSVRKVDGIEDGKMLNYIFRVRV